MPVLVVGYSTHRHDELVKAQITVSNTGLGRRTCEHTKGFRAKMRMNLCMYVHVLRPAISGNIKDVFLGLLQIFRMRKGTHSLASACIVFKDGAELIVIEITIEDSALCSNLLEISAVQSAPVRRVR